MPHDAFWTLSAASIVLALVCVAVVVADIFRGHRQKMRVMEWVWPLTALYAGPLGLWAYWTMGRAPSDGKMKRDKPFWQTVAVSTSHCGAGCTLGDLIGESVAFFLPISILGSRMNGAFALDFALAYAIGLGFQYVVIRPMKGLSPKQGLIAAFKADTTSIVAFQIGMYAWMAFSRRLTGSLEADDLRYWAMMQVAMVVGFLFSYPANWWLVRKGVKEAM